MPPCGSTHHRSRWPLILACLLPLAIALFAQSPSDEEREKALIQRAKSLVVSKLDGSLPKITMDYFLKYENRGREIHWEVNDCGEQTGNPETDRDREIPTCVEADFDVEHRSVSIMIAVGSVKQGASSTPSLFSAIITDINGQVRSLRNLGELPKELHRPLPKELRDLPAPVRGP